MSKLKKLDIDISTEEKKKEIYNFLCEFNKICEIYHFFGVEDTPYNNKYIHKIADAVGFDFAIYKERTKRYCRCCGKELTGKQKLFCSKSCAAKVNNIGRKHTDETKRKISSSLTKNNKEPRKNFGKRYCECCGKELVNKNSKFCSSQCFSEYMYEKKIQEWKEQPEHFLKEEIPGFIKRYLMAKYECKCQKCGWGEINETTGKIPLEVHHINGDCTDNREENLQLLCPNCHSLTPNHGSLNRNSKRYKLKKYKDLIKS